MHCLNIRMPTSSSKAIKNLPKKFIILVWKKILINSFYRGLASFEGKIGNHAID